MIIKLSIHPRPLVEEALLRRLREALELPDLRLWRDYYFELSSPPSADAVERLRVALEDPRVETVALEEPLPDDAVQVAYLRSIVDNENDSLVALCRLLGLDASAARVVTSYASASPELARRVRAHLVNPSIEELHDSEPAYSGLHPVGEAQEPVRYDLCGADEHELLAIGSEHGRNLDLDKMRTLQRIQTELGKAAVTDVLIEAADSRWSDHCMHTTWLALGNLLKRLRTASANTNNANIVSMFEDNAGVWRLYDGWSLAIKAETHNGPSAVSAYFGQLTKVGGVLRDILGTGLGADPIGVFEYTATGLPGAPAPDPGRPSPSQIASDTIRAVKEYGNTFGVPMMSAHMSFHRSYRAKPFALGGSVGLIPTSCAGRRRPQPGDLLVLIGGLTGNDGIHGASASSAGSTMDHASVQIGSPLEQVKFRQAIIDLRDAGCLRALTDLGGAGLNSGVGEMGDPGGVWLNTALVPLKTSALPPWIILLSESQERMILAVPPERIEEGCAVLDRHGVRNTVVGRFTADGRYTVVHAPEIGEREIHALDLAAPAGDPETGFSVPYELLQYAPPALTVTPVRARTQDISPWPRRDAPALASALARVLRDPEVASQRWATAQYDSTVQGNTLYGPVAGPLHVPTSLWAGTPIPQRPYAVLLATAFNPWLFEIDPVLATRQMFLSGLGKLVLGGVALEDICLCDNFYTPDREPDGFGWLVAMVDELAGLVEEFGTPVISGKDSSAGSVQTAEGLISVPPAVFLSAVGKLPDHELLRRNEWRQPGNLLVRIGPETSSPAGTVAVRALGVEAAPCLDSLSPARYRDYLSALAGVGAAIVSGRPIGAGGTLACLALGAIASDLGVELQASTGDLGELLAEHRCAAIVEVPEHLVDSLPVALEPRVVGRLRPGPRSLLLDGRELLDESAVAGWAGSWETALT
jgi:phosphoribosylformylglycinamidine (FGAM) synthase-like enzyme